MGLRNGQKVTYDIEFILGTDHRVVEFTRTERWCYLTLWAHAVRARRHKLPPQYNAKKLDRLANLVGFHRDSVTLAVRKCSENGLINVAETGEIVVVGVGVSHPWLVFKDGPNGESWQSKNGRVFREEVGSRKYKSFLSADKPPVVSEQPSQKKPPSPRQESWRRDIADFGAAYSARFPKLDPLPESVAGQLLKHCRMRGISPIALLERIAPHYDHPDRMMREMLLGRLQCPDDLPSWNTWDMRHDGELHHVSEMLTNIKAGRMGVRE